MIRRSVHPFGSDMSADIAVIGIASRFPAANDAGQFWSNLRAGICSVGEVPADRWPVDKYYSPDINEPGKSISKWGGWVSDIRAFDHAFFNISPREAASMDPQQRLLMEEAWHCVEDSGVSLTELTRSVTSAWVGVMSVNYGAQSVPGAGDVPDAYGCSGAYECMLANRLSFWLGLRGSSQPVNTACSSSLVALHEAKKALLLHEADFALVAGVGANVTPHKYISFSKARMLSPDGLCKTFDKDANGYVPGEGAGVLLLRRLSDAIRAGNRIYGVLKGTAVNHGGRSNSLTAPRMAAQRDVILSAWRDARVHPETISYIEAHGTGTSLGDPIEVEALTQAYRRYTKAERFCGLGSVKTNIGHLEAAAGIAGVIKVLLMMRHKAIPRTLHLNTVNPMINFDGSPFEPARSLRDWEPERGSVRRAGISSFGFGGVNAHTVIEEYVPDEPPARLLPRSTPRSDAEVRAFPFLLSAKSGQALNALVDRWRTFVKAGTIDNDGLEGVCRALTVNRAQFPYRFGALIASGDHLVRALNDFREQGPSPEPPKLVFRIGEPDEHMLAVLQAARMQDRVVARTVARCEDEYRLLQGNATQAADIPAAVTGFAGLYAVTKRLFQFGCRPVCIAGEGSGYLVSLALAGCISMRDAIALACAGDAANVNVGRRKQRYPVYDPHSRSVHTPLRCDAAYIAALANGCEVTPEEGGFYVGKAKALIENQFTFRRFLDEWNRELLAGGHQDIHAAVSRWTSDQSRGQTCLLIIALASCMRRLSRKWGLTQSPFASSITTEMLDLITDHVLPISHALPVLSGRQDAYGSVARIVNSRLEMLDQQKRYPLLRSCSQRSNGPDYVVHLTSAGKQSLPASIEPDALTIDIGNLPNVCEGSLKLTGHTSGKAFGQLVLECWKQGLNVKWQRYGWRQPVAHVDVPAYPFHPGEITIPAEIPQSRLSRHPGPDTASSVIYSRTVQAAADRIVGDHVIAGRTLVPGALMIDLMVEAARRESGAGNDTVSSVAFVSSAAVENALTLTTEIHPASSKVVVRSGGTLVCTARFGKASDTAARNTSIPDLTSCTPWQTPDYVYDRLRQFGYGYGERLQVIRNLWISDEHFLCDVEEYGSDEGHGSGVSPYLLDGVFQAAIAAGLAADCLGAVPSDQIYVPYLIDELRLLAPLAGRCRVAIRRRDVVSDTSGVRADITVFGPDGAPVLSITQLFLKRIAPARPPQPAVEISVPPLNAVIQTPVWQARGHSNDPGTTPAAIVIGGSDKHAAAVAEHLAGRGISVFGISAETEELEPALAERIRTLNASATPGTRLPIFYLNCLTPIADGEPVTAIRTRQQHCLKPLFHVAKAVSWGPKTHEIRVIAVTLGAQNVIANDRVHGFADGGVTGLGKVVALENKKVSFTAVDLDEHAFRSDEWVASVVEEAYRGAASDVAYRDGVRYVRQLSTVEPQRRNVSVRRDGGVFVVTGGAGGIGVQICRKVAETTECTVVVLGRSELKPAQLAEFEELRRSGLNVQYARADVSRVERLRETIDDVRAQYGPIRGVIHCAGVLEDKLIVNKDWDSFERVLMPKVYGVCALDLLTKDEPLEVFAVFSSVVSLFGNVGQADYAAANAFLDSFIHYRNRCGRPGRSVGINWTLWTGVGMGASDRAAAQIERMGIRAVDHKTALDAFEYALNAPTTQIVVLGAERPSPSGQVSAAESAGNCHKDAMSTPVTNPPARAGESRETDSLYTRIAANVAKTLLCHATDLEPDTDFREYGMDSVAVITLEAELEEDLGVSVHHSAILENPTLRQLTEHIKTVSTPEKMPARGQDSAGKSLTALPAESWATDSLYTRIAANVAKTLLCRVTDLDPDTDFGEYGMDSVAVITLESELEEDLGVSVHHSAILENPTLRQLTEHIKTVVSPAKTAAAAPEVPLKVPVGKPVPQAQVPEASEGADIQKTILNIVASALGAAPEHINTDAALSEYGLDSVGIMTIVCATEDEYPVDLHQSALVENNTVRGFASYVAGEISRQTQRSKPTQQSTNGDKQPRPASVSAPVSRPAAAQNNSSRNDIAVIGMACRFPQSPTLEQYWTNLTAGTNLICPVPADRWNVRDHYDPSPGKPKKTYSDRGGFIPDIDLFDAAFFRIPGTDAVEMDPQQRIFLELTQELLDRSGYRAAEVAGTRTAVMIGAHESEYGRRDRRRNKFEGKHGIVNVISNMIAGRVADHYDFRGPAETIYTACSSSLVAIHHACQMLRHGDCDMAIAGGIELLLDEEWFIGFSQSRVLSPDGKCFVFDERANGFVLAEGTGAVLLKPLDKALADGDQVHAVIRGSAINNDGRTMGLTTPNMKAQKEVIRQALIRSDIHPEHIGYYEAHGTGTALGDPIEIKAATEVFREYTDAKGYCAVGSVKSNMGHALAAAGIAAFIKVVLMLRNMSIPATLNCEHPHARFEFDKSPFFPVTKRTPWPSAERVNAAGISSFGFGGTNCHVVMTLPGTLVGQYSPVRQPLPLTKFNRKRYWLGSADDSATAMKLRVLFEQVASGRITQDTACAHLQSTAVARNR